MSLSHEHVGPKILGKIKFYVLTRAELLFPLCYEIPCSRQAKCYIFHPVEIEGFLISYITNKLLKNQYFNKRSLIFRSYYSLKLYDGGNKFSKLEFKFYTLTKRFMSAVTRVSATNVTDMNLFLCETFKFQGMRQEFGSAGAVCSIKESSGPQNQRVHIVLKVTPLQNSSEFLIKAMLLLK